MKKGSILKKFISLGLCAATAIVFTAYSDGSGGSSSSDSTGKAKYIVATEPTYAPFEYTDENNKIIGLDVDIMDAIAEDQGFEIEWSSLAFDSLFPALNSGNADIVAAAVSSNPDREKQADFSEGYYVTGDSMAVKSDSKVNTIDELSPDSVVAVQIGTTLVDKVQKLIDEGKVGSIVQLDTVSTCMLQLQNGDVDAVAADSLTIDDYISSQGKAKNIGEFYFDEENPMRIAVKKGNAELLDKINSGLKHIKENGKYAEICKKWNVEPLK